MATCFECGKKIGFLANRIMWEGKRICGACDYKKGVERENHLSEGDFNLD